jgi:phosphoglycolate phosphatase
MAPLGNLRAALLDFDGTLVDLPVDWDALRDGVARLFAGYGIDCEMRPLYPAIAEAFVALRERGIPPQTRGNLRRRINRLMTETEMKALDRAEPLPGSRELLERLRRADLTLIVQTSNSVYVVRAAWARFRFPPVDAVIGRESARLAKPHPGGVRRELRRLHLRGDQCVVIGDGDFDIELGRALGARTIHICRGDLQVASDLSADAEISSLSEVLPMLTGQPELAGVTA